MNVYVRSVKQGRHVLIAACDAELLGKTLKHGKCDFKICEQFYGGLLTDVEAAIKLIRTGTVVNLIGRHLVQRAIKEGIIHPEAIIHISGIPHAQIVKL